MAKKKEIVWHKKKGKFIPSTLAKAPPPLDHSRESPPLEADSKKKFWKNLETQIKKAAEDT